MKLINAFHGQIADIFGVKSALLYTVTMWALGLFKLLQNVRLLYRNSDGGGGLSVAVGVQFMLARVVLQVGLVYIPKSFCFPFHSSSLY
jgi:hypothetical protein